MYHTKRKQFQGTASCLNQNMILRTRHESKNLAIFHRNIYIVNRIKQDENYLAKLYTNLNVKVLSWKHLLTV